MAEGWKQIWKDMVNAARGAPPAPEADGEQVVTVPATEVSSAEVSPMPVAQVVTASISAPTMKTISAGSSAAPTEQVDATSVPSAADEVSAEVVEQPESAEVETMPAPPRGWRDRLVWVVVALLAVGFFTQSWWAPLFAPQPPAPNVVATFKDGQITSEQLLEHLALLVPEKSRAQFNTPEGLRTVVEEMVMDELARRWGAERKKDDDDTFSHTMQHISEDINLDTLHTQLHTSDIPVTESEIQAYYQANQAAFGGRALDAVRQQIRDALTTQKEKDYVTAYVARLKANASVTLDLTLLDTPEPSDDDVRRYYDANRAQYQLPPRVVVDEIQIPISGNETAARQRADAVMLKLRAGATMLQASQEVTSTRAFTATTIISGTRSAEWMAAAMRLDTGALSEVLRDGALLSIVRLRERQDARIPALAEVRAQALAHAREQQSEEWFKQNGDKTLFTLKGKRYTLGQFYREYQELPPETRAQYAGAAGRKKIAEQLIERLLIVEDSLNRAPDEKNQAEIEQIRLDVLKEMFHQENIDDKVKVSDEDIRKFYEQNQSRLVLPPRARIRYIRITHGQTADEERRAIEKANEVYRKLAPGPFQTGADFAAMAREYSEDPESAARGGEASEWVGESLNAITELKEHPFHQQVLSLQVGQISPPFEYGDSIYIVQPIERSEPQPLTLEQATPLIKEELTHRKHDELLATYSEQLRQQVGLVIYDSTLRALLEQIAKQATPAP